MLTKINIFSIIKDHILTLRNNRTQSIAVPDLLLFFLLPAAVSGAMVYLGILLNDGLVNALITSFSIFSALLFNLLLLVYDIAGKLEIQKNRNDQLELLRATQRQELLREIYINVSFSILVSTFTVVILLPYFFKPTKCDFLLICSLQSALALIAYYLAILFVLTLLMVLKRIYRLLAKAFDSD